MKDENEPFLIDKAKDYALRWLNAHDLTNPLPDDYFVKVKVIMHKDGNDEVVIFGEHLILLDLDSEDEGGTAMMFAHMTTEGEVLWSAWYFDTDWREMKWPPTKA